MSERIPTDDEIIAGEYTTGQLLAATEKIDELLDEQDRLQATNFDLEAELAKRNEGVQVNKNDLQLVLDAYGFSFDREKMQAWERCNAALREKIEDKSA